MNTYELTVLYHPDLEIDLAQPKAKVEKLINDNGGKITATDSWGKRKLAYNIAGNEQAVYEIYTVELPSENVARIETALNINDEVIRYLIIKPDFKAIAKAEAAKAARASRKEAKTEVSGDDDKNDK